MKKFAHFYKMLLTVYKRTDKFVYEKEDECVQR